MKLFYKYAQVIPVFILAIFLVSCGDDDDDDELPQIVAGFTQTINENTGTVTFINTSENADTYLWDFGDSTTSTEINPIKTYINGEYTVVLTASNGAGASDTFEDTFTILIPEIASLPITFDAANTRYEPEVFNGASFEIVANPDESGTNDKAGNVGAITNSGAAFEGVAFDLGTAVNLTNGNTIEMNFWSEEAIDVLLKLEITETNAIETAASHGGTGWEILSFEFASSDTYPKLVIFADGPGTTSGTFYFDDVVQAGVVGTVPVIILNGDATVNINVGGTFEDPGAEANDAEDGDISDQIVIGGDVVDINVEGTYMITYNVTDSDGNDAAEVVRTVIVSAGDPCTPETAQSLSATDLNLTFQTDPGDDIFNDGGAYTFVDNPDFDNMVNTSCKVGQIVRDAGLEFANSQISFDSKFDFNSNSGFKLKVYSSETSYQVTLKLEDKADGGIATEISLTTSVGANEWEELTFDFPASESDKYDKIVLFFQLETFTDGTYFIDDLALYGSGSGGGTEPTTSAPVPPARDAADVISIFGETYTNITGINYDPDWGQSGHTLVNTSFDPGDGNLILAYPNFNYQGT
ncbi:MAG: immunoglobulin-like domain-containing protein, partial [Bacteroidota bacterium]